MEHFHTRRRKRDERRRVCNVCGYKHPANRIAGFFLPSGSHGGLYDVVDRDKLDKDGPTDTGALDKGSDYDRQVVEAAERGISKSGSIESPRKRDSGHDGKGDAVQSPREEILGTPKFVSNIGYVRCTCCIGVPEDDPTCVPVAWPRYVGEIMVNPKNIPEPNWDEIQRSPPPPEVLYLVLQCLDGRSLGVACVVCGAWREMCQYYMPHYTDWVQMGRVGHFQAMDVPVDALAARGNVICAAGTSWENRS